MDTIKIDVPTFLRLLELAREDVKDDADLHTITTMVTKISKNEIVTMKHYDSILEKCESCKEDMKDLKRLSGL